MARAPHIYRVYIADGFADDCDELIHRCSRVDILSYQTFCIYYKDMNFASLYQGRTSNSEIAELSEELLQVAKHYMVQDTSNFEESIAGLFLVYALQNLQPYNRFARLRLVPEDLPALSRIEQVARRERRYDVLYVMGSMLVKGPVEYHAAGRERGLENSLRKYLEDSCTVDLTGMRPKGVYFRQNEELDIIREMAGISKRYSTAKEQIPGFKTRGLKYSNDNLANDLGTSLKRLINGMTEEITPSEHYDTVQEIKARAMRGAVGAIRHLSAVAHRSPEKSPQKKNETTTSQFLPLPTSPSTPKTPKRPAKSKPPSAKNKRTRTGDLDDSSTTESEDTTPEKGKMETEESDENPEQEIQVQFESLPTIISTESDGKSIEIEIIDNMKKKGKKKTDDAMFKKPRTSPRIKKLTKREMKKTILKSKFKKMGMLPIANFEDK